MKLISYKHEKKYRGTYCKLIKNLYGKYPIFAETRAKDIEKAFNGKNPFLKFGAWENFLLLEEGKPAAHISAIIDKRLPSDIGLIGFFDSLNDFKYAKTIFGAAIKFLSKNQKKIIRGPINLTTWQDFRVSYPETNPPFSPEPFTRAYYRHFFEKYGFKIAQFNISTIQGLEETGFDKFEKEFKRLKESGFIFEIIDNKKLSTALPEVYGIISETFDDTWTFSKISLQEFIYYLKDLSKLANKYFLYLVRNQNRKAVAFFWGMPDIYSKYEKRLVLKTMGVLPEYQKMGIGRALFYLVYCKAGEDNVSKCIFSTMRSDNEKIKKLTAAAQKIYRRYAVYELTL